MGAYIRMNNKFVYEKGKKGKKGKKYYLTNVTNRSKWLKMSDSEKDKCKGKDVTTQVKPLLKKHGSKSNINFKTKPSKKKIRTRRKKVKGG